MYLKGSVWLSIFLVAIVSLNGIKCAKRCSRSTVNMTLGSEVLLPCFWKGGQTDEVDWIHNSSLLNITLNGTIIFEDPRDGRVTVFSDLVNKRNFSISIHQLQASDLGSYRCQQGNQCHIVELKYLQVVYTSRDTGASTAIEWYYIAAGIGGFLLLVITCRLIYEFRGLCVKKATESYDVNFSQNQGANPSGNRTRARRNINCMREEDDDSHYEDMNRDEHSKDYESMQEHVGQHEDSDRDEDDYINTERAQGEGQYINSGRQDPRGHYAQTGNRQQSAPAVYENDEHDPTGLQIRPQPQNRDLTEVQSRSQSRAPYYVNQSEICNPDSAAKRKKHRKKKKSPPTEYQFRNPIYGDGSVEPDT